MAAEEPALAETEAKWDFFVDNLSRWLQGLHFWKSENQLPEKADFQRAWQDSDKTNITAVFQKTVYGYVESALSALLCVAVGKLGDPTREVVDVPVQSFLAWVAQNKVDLSSTSEKFRLETEGRPSLCRSYLYEYDFNGNGVPSAVHAEKLRDGFPALLTSLKVLQGVVSYTLLQHPDNVDLPSVVLIGDQHTDYSCPDGSCELPNCAKVDEGFWEALNASAGRERPIDIYIETWLSRSHRAGISPYKPNAMKAGALQRSISKLLPCSVRVAKAPDKPTCMYPNLRVHYGETRSSDGEELRFVYLCDAVKANNPNTYREDIANIHYTQTAEAVAAATVSHLPWEGLTNPTLAGDRLYHEFRQLDKTFQLQLLEYVLNMQTMPYSYNLPSLLHEWLQLKLEPAGLPAQVVADLNVLDDIRDFINRAIVNVDLYTVARILKPHKDSASPPVRVAVVNMGDIHSAQQTLLFQAVGYEVVKCAISVDGTKCLNLESPPAQVRVRPQLYTLENTKCHRLCGPVLSAVKAFSGVPDADVAVDALVEWCLGAEELTQQPLLQRAELLRMFAAMEQAYKASPRSYMYQNYPLKMYHDIFKELSPTPSSPPSPASSPEEYKPLSLHDIGDGPPSEFSSRPLYGHSALPTPLPRSEGVQTGYGDFSPTYLPPMPQRGPYRHHRSLTFSETYPRPMARQLVSAPRISSHERRADDFNSVRRSLPGTGRSSSGRYRPKAVVVRTRLLRPARPTRAVRLSSRERSVHRIPHRRAAHRMRSFRK